MKALLALTVLLIAYIILKPSQRPKVTHQGRSIASVSGIEASPQKVDLSSALDSHITQITPKPPPSPQPLPPRDEINLKNNLKAELENGRKALNPRTLQWSEQLPKPSNPHEDVFNFYLQVAYENDSDATSVILERASDFLRLDNSFTHFVSENMKIIESGRDQNVRNFIYEFSKSARPNESFDNALIDDISRFHKNPQNFRDSDLSTLRTLIESSPGLSRGQKQDLLTNDF